jgi:hypothetical protein
VIWQATLDRINRRLLGLSFEIRLATIPEQCFEIGRIQYGWRVARAGQAVEAFGNRQIIRKTFGLLVAGSATYLAISTETGVME